MATTPLATNTLNSLGTYFQRQIYKTIYPTGSIPEPIDLWYEKQLYGKIDNNNNAIFISEASLKQCRNEDQIIFAANFVADAFEDFRTHFKRAEASNRLNLPTEFSDIQPKIGWKSLNSLYHTYINLIFESFLNVFIKENNRKDNILDFQSFLKAFIEYIDIITISFPFTRSSFIKSKFSSIESSGLSIQIKDENHAIDREKFEKFIQDGNFDFYTKTARKFGFLVDKNAPWRLVADIASPAMKPYLEKNDIKDINSLFEDLYFKAFKTDIEVLKIYIIQFYNTFVSLEPVSYISKTSQKIKDETILEKVRRKPFPIEDANKLLNFTFWNKLYIYIRAKESLLSFTQFEFDRLVNTVNTLEKSIDTDHAREYINRHFSGLPSQDQSGKKFSFF